MRTARVAENKVEAPGPHALGKESMSSWTEAQASQDSQIQAYPQHSEHFVTPVLRRLRSQILMGRIVSLRLAWTTLFLREKEKEEKEGEVGGKRRRRREKRGKRKKRKKRKRTGRKKRRRNEEDGEEVKEGKKRKRRIGGSRGRGGEEEEEEEDGKEEGEDGEDEEELIVMGPTQQRLPNITIFTESFLFNEIRNAFSKMTNVFIV